VEKPKAGKALDLMGVLLGKEKKGVEDKAMVCYVSRRAKSCTRNGLWNTGGMSDGLVKAEQT
jgi:hypothetical protein